MKYFIFFISCLLIFIIVANIITLHTNYSDLSRFGYGYFTGIAIMLILLSTTAYFSGKKIYRRLSTMEEI
ncbi:hypothetical protein MUGA111182_14545 [Mucilaginibacter galii]